MIESPRASLVCRNNSSDVYTASDEAKRARALFNPGICLIFFLFLDSFFSGSTKNYCASKLNFKNEVNSMHHF